MPISEDVRQKVHDGGRVDRDEAIALLRDGDFLELGMLADVVRWRKHPDPIVTYIIDRNINYTNVCTAQCAFCAFYRDLPSKEGYLLGKEELTRKIDETIALGGRQILLQGGLHPDLGIEYYEELFRWMKATFPIWIHGLSPAEVQHIARVSQPEPGGGAAPPDGRRARLDSRRRRRDPLRPGAQGDRHRQGLHRGVARGHGDGPPPRDEDHRHHDVRPRGDPRGAGRPPAPPAGPPGPHRRASPPSSPGPSSRRTPPWPATS